MNSSVKDTNITRNKFKMYFVKTEKPNVFRRIDELGHILFNTDIYPVENALSKKQNAYVEKSCDFDNIVLKEITGFTEDGQAIYSPEIYPIGQSYAKKSCNTGLPSWKDVIGFTDDNGIVTIHKSHEEMIQTANEQFDIDLCFVDKEPDITYDPKVMIDVELIDDGDDDNYWQVEFGKYDKTDILITIQEKNEIQDRITKALNKYHIYFDDDGLDFVESDNPINETMERTMKEDLKKNFNIRLHIIRDSSYK